jgi:predicted nucleic acid-binding protein
MASFLPDTSCMVAAVCAWHEHHERATRAIEDRLKQRHKMIVAAAALVEAYSVLTRLPSPHRLSPSDALNVLEANFVSSAKLMALGASGYRSLLHGAPEGGISGGRIYDAVIACSARRAKVQALLTFNEAHFASFEDDDLQIIVPQV